MHSFSRKILFFILFGATSACQSRADARPDSAGLDASSMSDSFVTDAVALDANVDAGSEVDAPSAAIQIAGGPNHTCALLASGRVKCWGANQYGQLGNDDVLRQSQSIPVFVVGIQNAIEIVSGSTYTCARLQPGTVKCWGQNSRGQLGNGTMVDSGVPILVAGLSDATQVAARQGHTCAVKSTNQVACWGVNFRNQAGSESNDLLIPTTISGLNNIVQVATTSGATCTRSIAGAVACWGDSEYGELGNAASVDTSTPTLVGSLTSGVLELHSGNGHFCARKSTTVLCWGWNPQGQIGNGTSGPGSGPQASVKIPAVVALPNAATVVVSGASSNCAKTATGVYCWGNNAYGELGFGDQLDRVSPAATPAAISLPSFALMQGHSCSVQISGSILCWGNNASGQLGDGLTTSSIAAVTVIGIP